jgi:kynurenine formamidase
MKTFTLGVVAAVLFAAVAARVAFSQQAAGASRATGHVVTQSQLDGWKTSLSNWGRWGKDDEKGTLNLITPAKRKQAAALVKEGFAVSLARDADTEKTIDNPQPYQDVMTNVSATGSGDRISVSFHGYAHTHFDGLAHHFLNGKLYNGYSHDNVTMEGMATKNAVINDKVGIFTRGILMDIPRLKGVPYLEPGTPIYIEDLEAWEKQAGVTAGPGDAVFIRTGRWVRRAKLGPWDVGKLAAGLDPSVLPWIRKRDIAFLGSESALSAVPIPPEIVNGDDYLPVHNFVLVALGMNLFDDCDLDAISEAAAARKRWEFLVTAAPLPMPKGTGSPVNPTAVF